MLLFTYLKCLVNFVQKRLDVVLGAFSFRAIGGIFLIFTEKNDFILVETPVLVSLRGEGLFRFYLEDFSAFFAQIVEKNFLINLVTIVNIRKND